MHKLLESRFTKLVLVTLGTFLVAFGVVYFLVPVNLAIGGATGLAMVIAHIFGGNIGLFIFLVNIPIFIIGFLSEGKEFLAKSLYGTALLSVFSQLLEYMPASSIHDVFLSCIYGGVLTGVGIGLAYLGGGTTGGTVILAKVLPKKIPSLTIGTVLIMIDFIVVALAAIVFGQLSVALYSGIALYISSKSVDIVMIGFNTGKTAFIITKQEEEITNRIHDELKRGATVFYAQGTYSKEEKRVLLCTLLSKEVVKLRRIVNEVDRNAFLILQNTTEILGEGFN